MGRAAEAALSLSFAAESKLMSVSFQSRRSAPRQHPPVWWLPMQVVVKGVRERKEGEI